MAGNMAEPIIVREWPITGQFQWLDLRGTEYSVCFGSLTELADAAQQRPLIMVWPAASALLVEIDLPLRNAAQISKALPYAMEDLLAEDVDRYHLVWHRQVASGRVVVAAVTHELLANCRQRFESVGLVLNMILPEPLLLPWQSGECGLLIDTQQAVFRHAEWLGGGGEIDLSILLLQKLHQQNEVGDTLGVWSDTESAQIEGFCNDWPGKIHKQKSIQPLMLYRQQWQFAKPLNLLTGDYAIRTADSTDLTKYWPAAAIVLVALLLQVVMQWQLVSRQQQQLQAMQASSEAMFKQAFPEIKRLVNLKAQADQRLSELQQQNSQQQSGFLPLLYRSGMHLKGDRQIQIQRLQFSNDSLQFRISAADTSSIEQFERRLTDEGLQVERLTGEAKTGEVEIVIRQN
jgi:general secretion pathway protein L